MDLSKVIFIVAKLAFEVVREGELYQKPEKSHVESWEKATRKGIFNGKILREISIVARVFLKDDDGSTNQP
ncbi:hypothetical protein [Alteribacillus sp. HJP-4]|uniref:hypothetical protein n=1 Tax=Alteribacillus sp. HJP-4 TaxID=2775394 RepID=UPI0035CCF1DD